MSLLNSLLLMCITAHFIFCDAKEEVNRLLRRNLQEDARKHRHDRFNRLKSRRIDDDIGIPTHGGDRYEDLTSSDLDPIPKDVFNDIKLNGRWITEGENHEQYEEWLTDDDIRELLAEGESIKHEENDYIDDIPDFTDQDDLNGYQNPNEEGYNRRLQYTCCGTDRRYEIRGDPITSTPSKYVGRFRYETNSRTYQCSGILVGSGWVLTAAHCVHEGDGGSWFRNKRFRARMNSRDSSTAIYTSSCSTFSSWMSSSNSNYDMALCKLRSRPSGLGGIRFGYDNNLNTRDDFTIQGYPTDKPNDEMWGTDDRLSDTNSYQLFCDSCDTRGGMSGSGWVHNNYVYGVHRGVLWSGRANFATRIDKYKYDWICEKIGRRRC